MKEHSVTATVVKAQGHCALGHKLGDVFELGPATPPGFCAYAFAALWPTLNLLMHGGSYPWDKEPGTTFWSCPDNKNLVVFQLKRTD